MKKPIIHLYAISFNEGVLMPHFLKHYSDFCEKIHIYDNCSDDSTLEICRSFKNVNTIQFDTNNQIRDDIYLKIKNEAWKKSRGVADYVIICDIDELIYCNAIVDFFKISYQDGISIIKCEGYNMITDEIPILSENIIQKYPYGVRNYGYDKVLIFDPNKIEEINFDFGAHLCSPIGYIKYSASRILLLHYKYISLEYLQNRYKLFSSRLSSYNKKFRLGYHYSFSKFRIAKEYRGIKKESKNVLETLK
jgi:hypothetical protein